MARSGRRVPGRRGRGGGGASGAVGEEVVDPAPAVEEARSGQRIWGGAVEEAVGRSLGGGEDRGSTRGKRVRVGK